MGRFNSIKSKIMGVTIVGIILTCIVNLTTMIPMEKNNTNTEVKVLLLSMAETEGKMIECESKSKKFTIDKIHNELNSITIKGYKTGYTYIVDSNGIMRYHPTYDKIGKPVENYEIKKVVAGLKNGDDLTEGVVTYKYKGKTKYSSYYVTKNKDYIIVFTLDKNEAFLSLRKTYSTLIIESVLCLVIFGAMAKIIAKGITKPINMLSKSIEKTSRLDFTKDNNKLSLRNDEVGDMGKQIEKLISILQEMIARINNVSVNINDNANNLLTSASNINKNSSKNASTSQELAANMEETSVNINEIDNSINDVKTNTKDIFNMTEKGLALSSDIMERAERLKKDTLTANNRTKKIYEDLANKSRDAMEKAKSVAKVQELADSIKDIAEQTSLLSLNASIEAARAGEAGKGFVVVAGEIGNLATMSTETVNNITLVVDEVQVAVDNMASCFEKTLKFLSDNVFKDYELFLNVGNQYSIDAETFKENINKINDSINLLNSTIGQIAQSAENITETIEECANGISNISQKTTEISNEINKTNSMSEENVKSSKLLQEVVGKFKLQ